MPRGIGRAMEKAIAGDEEEAPPEARESLLMHPQRRELYRLLCMRPCATAGELARESGQSANAVRWHLRRMAAADLVAREGTTYHPRGFIDPKDRPLFRLLAEGGSRDVFRAIAGAPGSNQREVCEALGVSRQSVFKAASVLESEKLVSSIEDGRYRRYYPTDLLKRRREAYRSRARGFADALVKRLHSGGLAPHVLRRTDDHLLVRIASGKSAEVLDLPLDPFAAALD